MLAQQHRMRTSVQFSMTTRSGVRSGRRNLVLYVLLTHNSSPSISGFVVSKAVGNAVMRNLVKRRLRELVAETIKWKPYGMSIVVRALPASANASWDDLVGDYRNAWNSIQRKLEAPESGPVQACEPRQAGRPQ
ncbi:ribonuclease P protein component [Rothia uropygialis]|uniref:ribonuclease P protein component n=1 Tax=Kocuria sp. 36 TaxID=1415402 RepID=UPI00101BA9B3|nr:ribonuclease P protein component [Kocuria sp. 36]